MASTHKSLRSGTANKRPTTAIADGQIALNTNSTSPGLFFKDSTGASIIKIGPVHVGATAPNATPAAGGSSGNSTGEVWLDNSLTPVGVKIWNGSAWVNATPAGSTTVQGLLELATDAETQAGSDTARAVTPASLQSKVSDSTSTTSSTTIASSTAVKSAYDLATAAVPASGGTVTGNLEIGNTGSLSFEGATADGFETTIAVTDPTADRTITLPDTTGTVVTTGDTGTVTSTMILDGTIVNGDINASAAIAHSKLANITAGSVLLGNATNVPTATALTGDVTVNSSGVTAISSGVIVNADVNASAAIAGTKISPDFGSQTITTTGVVSAALGAAATPSISFTGDLNTGIYSPGADQVAISTNGAGRLFVDASGGISIGASSTPGALLGVTRGAASLLDLHRTGVAGEARLNFYNDNSASAATVAGRIAGLLTTTTAGSESGALLFVTNNSGTVGERARITAEGRLGLGTSSPAELLHVSGGNIRFGSTGFIGEDSSVSPALISIGVNPGSTYTVTRDIQFLANPGSASSSVLMTIKGQTGRVGIGTAAPSTKLDIREDSAGSVVSLLKLNNNAAIASGKGVKIEFGLSDNSNASARGYIENVLDGSNGTYMAFGVNDGATGTFEAIRIDRNRRLLVGTSSASGNSLFQVEGNIQHEGAIYSYASKSWSTAAAAALFDVKMSPGHCGAVLNWIMVDASAPNGVRTGTLTIAVRGSGNTKIGVVVGQVDGAVVTSGTVSTLTWSAAISSNEVRLTATPSTDSGTATVYLWGSSPFFTSDGITAL